MLLCAGLLTLDVIVFQGRVLHSIGGTAGNVAAMVSWLGSPTALAARVGTDLAGALVEQDLERLRVDRSMLVHDIDAMPRITHEVGAISHSFSVRCVRCGRRMPGHRRLTKSQVDRVDEDNQRFSALFVDRVSPPLAALATRWANHGKLVVFEPWHRPAEPLLAQMLASAHLVKVSDNRQLVHALDGYPRRRGAVDLVTLGADGLRWRIDQGPWRDLPAKRINAVDAAGAGDWLTASLLHGHGELGLDSQPAILEERLARGQAVAALSVLCPGALGLVRALRRDDLETALRSGLLPSTPERSDERHVVSPPTGCCTACLLPLGT